MAEGEVTFREHAEQRLQEIEARKGQGRRRTPRDFAVGIGSLGVLILLGLLGLGLVALAVWFLVVTAGILLKLVGAIAIVVVASLAWQQIRGGRRSLR